MRPRPGDVFFHVPKGKGVTANHAGLVANDTTRIIEYKKVVYEVEYDAKEPYRYNAGLWDGPIRDDHNAWIVFRLTKGDGSVPRRAALLVQDWVGKYSVFEMGSSPRAVTPTDWRSFFAERKWPDCKFGSAGRARLLKYQRRPDQRPTNVRDAEVCVLAYQLATKEGDPGFIQLDAKYTTPPALFTYLYRNKAWDCVGFRRAA